MLVDYLSQYTLFLAKTLTFVIALLFVISAIVTIAVKNKKQHEGSLSVRHLNQEKNDLTKQLQSQTLPKPFYKKWHKAQKAEEKKHKLALKAQEENDETEPRLFVIRFDGDIRASQVTALRETVTAILDVFGPHDEVLLILESMGGLVPHYGLAAAQLDRLRQHQIKLTVAIDKVAASGGYMMAVVANHIAAAPFAVVGSIGVLAQLPNFHRLLEKHDIDFEQQMSGKYKRTLTVFGENTNEGRAKFQEEIEKTHQLFKHYIADRRPQVVLDEVATGEHWHALDALKYQLIDEIKTSDDIILDKIKTHQAYELSYEVSQPLMKKLVSGTAMLIDQIWDKVQYKIKERY